MPRSTQRGARSLPCKNPSGESVLFWRDAALPMIEGRRASHTRAGYRDHTHPTWSVGIVDAGESRVRLGPRVLTLSAGQVVLIPPECVHSCNPLPSRAWSYRMFHLDSAWVASSCRAPAPSGPVVLCDAKARRRVNEIESLFHDTGAPSRREQRLATALRALFVRTGRHPAGKADRAHERAFEQARRLLDERLVERVSLADLEQAAGLSRYQLIRLFRRKTGLTPHAYQLDRRIHHGRELLKRGLPLADVAQAVGFADQSHFQRVFRPRVAVTPAVYSRTGAAPRRRSPTLRTARF